MFPLSRTSIVSKQRVLFALCGTRTVVFGRSNYSSFIEKAKILGTQSLIGPFHHSQTKYDRNLDGFEILGIEKGHVKGQLLVNEKMENSFGTLHGGATCMLIDVVGTMCFLSMDNSKPGVSLEINVSYLSAGKSGENIIVKGSVLKMGKRIGFSEITLYSADEKTLLAVGRHTKAFQS